jgi:adenylate cyclase
LFDQIQEKSRQLEATSQKLDVANRDLQAFLSPEVARLIESGVGLEPRPAEITVVFCDLRGYTAFAETTQPEYVVQFLEAYHGALGPLIIQYGGTLERFTGDGLMVFFNAPQRCPNPEEQAVRMALKMRESMRQLIEQWRYRRNSNLGFGIGIDQGYARVGRIGFPGRYDYAAIGPVTNCAARVCSEAGDNDVLITQPVYAAVEDLVEVEFKGGPSLKGFQEPVRVYNVLQLTDAASFIPHGRPSSR